MEADLEHSVLLDGVIVNRVEGGQQNDPRFRLRIVSVLEGGHPSCQPEQEIDVIVPSDPSLLKQFKTMDERDRVAVCVSYTDGGCSFTMLQLLSTIADDAVTKSPVEEMVETNAGRSSEEFEELFGPSPPLEAAAPEPPANISPPLRRPLSRTQSETNPAGRYVEFRKEGNAMDVIAVRGRDGSLCTTSWHVAFPYSRWRSGSDQGVGDVVSVLVNGIRLSSSMVLQKYGRGKFVGGNQKPPVSDLQAIDLHDGVNIIRYEHNFGQRIIRFVEARLFVWGPDESIVVTDVDGTITPNDLEGHIRTLRLAQYDFLHAGVCQLFDSLRKLGLQILYLTARPITWVAAPSLPNSSVNAWEFFAVCQQAKPPHEMTRDHLEKAHQGGVQLPVGPIITNPEGVLGAFATEVINRTPNIFKAAVLNEVVHCFISAGRRSQLPLFVCGFGNRPTDARAYTDAGIPLDCIFIIDTYSNIRPVNGHPSLCLLSYHDPKLLMFLIPFIRDFFPPDEQHKLDALFTKMAIDAEKDEQKRREQLLLQEELMTKGGRGNNGNNLQRVQAQYVDESSGRLASPEDSKKVAQTMMSQAIPTQPLSSTSISEKKSIEELSGPSDEEGDLFGPSSSSISKGAAAEVHPTRKREESTDFSLF